MSSAEGKPPAFPRCYQGSITDGERHTDALIYLSYDPSSNQITLETNQHFGPRITGEMKNLLEKLEKRIAATGRVARITIGAKPLPAR